MEGNTFASAEKDGPGSPQCVANRVSALGAVCRVYKGCKCDEASSAEAGLISHEANIEVLPTHDEKTSC